jgi:hypothetical protein
MRRLTCAVVGVAVLIRALRRDSGGAKLAVTNSHASDATEDSAPRGSGDHSVPVVTVKAQGSGAAILAVIGTFASVIVAIVVPSFIADYGRSTAITDTCLNWTGFVLSQSRAKVDSEHIDRMGYVFSAQAAQIGDRATITQACGSARAILAARDTNVPVTRLAPTPTPTPPASGDLRP